MFTPTTNIGNRCYRAIKQTLTAWSALHSSKTGLHTMEDIINLNAVFPKRSLENSTSLSCKGAVWPSELPHHWQKKMLRNCGRGQRRKGSFVKSRLRRNRPVHLKTDFRCLRRQCAAYWVTLLGHRYFGVSEVQFLAVGVYQLLCRWADSQGVIPSFSCLCSYESASGYFERRG